MPKRPHNESAAAPPTIIQTSEPATKRTKPNVVGPSSQIPSWTTFTKWTSSTITKSYPPLPPVLDASLETAALTHSGMRKSLSDPSYEKLEWVGDVYLELIASEFLFQTFPSLDPGKLSHYREMLVRNSTLGRFSVHYGLDKRANFPAEFGLGGRPNGTKVSDKQRAKALGDIFEAYVGAVVRSDPENGLRRAAEWMKVLWGPVLERQIREEESGGGVRNKDTNPKTELESLIGAPGVKIEYRDMPPYGKKDRDTGMELFFVGCFLNGWGETDLQLGYGQAVGKKEAGQKAAAKALENKKLIKRFAEKKKALQAARAAQAEKAAPTGKEAQG
ncbi:ribonuclease III [Parathielavia appendiculata]|uniref:Ribonuclease III n=1 Tax=Parathielavia appendiculata TaxID=2587402 RepID=A0AAN6Z0X2_9PEZI|nr:ribonuclease III [Parathielavia appendiculata]